jgi:hypothetical protein
VLPIQSEDEVSLLLCMKEDHEDSIPAARRHGRRGCWAIGLEPTNEVLEASRRGMGICFRGYTVTWA